MLVDSISFQGHRCFKKEWAGFASTKPINVIIGRNNTGKSHLLDLVAAICQGKWGGRSWRYRCEGTLDDVTLKTSFHEGYSGGELGGNHWDHHGARFVGVRIAWTIDESLNARDLAFPDGFDPTSPNGERSTAHRLAAIQEGIKDIRHRLSGTTFFRLLADRDVRPEVPNNQLELFPDGRGATNIIRRYIVTSNPEFPREIVHRDLLAALNEIFGADGHFTEIQVKLHDDAKIGMPEGHWEVFLGEEKKGLISLTNSGSGLKTVMLVLLSLLVVPEIEKKKRSAFTFAFEELENNLHPALLRRLFQFLEDYAVREAATIFLTTHSSAALDLFGVSKNAQIIHVTHDGEAARASTVSAHFDHLGVISELGAKPSDLLQANGIIWVEGPSDCIYLNRWLDLYTDGRLREGRDYICAFYGGSLLARTQFKSPEDAEKELINLFRVNPNIVVICDGDRSGARAQLKDRVERIKSEVAEIPGAHCWITSAREIENYLPGEVISEALGIAELPDPGQYESFFPRERTPGSSYVETNLKRKQLDKMELAVSAVPHMALESMKKRFDWDSQLLQVAERISVWNR
jgi:putative ATP-dependent endonuclease of OLD family